MILSDVDGVLTDGRLIFGPDGGEYKCFHARDGLGSRIWADKGNRFVFVTRRCTDVVRRRAEELGVDAFQGVQDKCALLESICEKYSLRPDEIAYLGDDLVDYNIMQKVGLAVAPSDAVEEVRAIADYVTQVPGGWGVAREAIELILKARGEWGYFGF